MSLAPQEKGKREIARKFKVKAISAIKSRKQRPRHQALGLTRRDLVNALREKRKHRMVICGYCKKHKHGESN